jgi:ribose 5-phosphate isomerase B
MSSKPSETVVIAVDHAGFELKAALKEQLSAMGYAILDLGTSSPEMVDYPDFADAAAKAITDGLAARGVLVCGSGVGMSIAANRHSAIRAALCHEAEAARLSRLHNDANVLVLGARVIDPAAAKACVEAFFTTEFEAGRHARRVGKLA